ncbi:MAG: ABC transporter substrate-binding protein [Deltaproteobacteria bacterium]|nr:ABC transporter substrate-binding protein [Deltaproteobacteria bacterium]
MDRSLMRIFTFFLLLGYGSEIHAAQGGITQAKISQSNVGPSSVPLWVAQGQGMFKKRGLEVEAIFVRNSTIQIAALTTGDMQFSSTGGAPTLSAAAGGVSLKIFANLHRRLPYDIAVRPDIKSPEDLRGKGVGVTNIGGTTWMAAVLALEHLGLDPGRDNINLQALGNQTVLVQSLDSGRIEAILVDHFFSRELKEKGFRILFEGRAANIPFAGTGLVTTRAYFDQRADIVENVLKGLLEAQAFIADPRNKPIVLKTIRERLKIAEPSVQEWGYQFLLETMERKPYPALEGLRNIQRFMKHNAQVAKVRVEDLIDDRIMRKLDESGFIDGLYKAK